MKKLTLKLIASTDAPVVGDLANHPDDGLGLVVQNGKGLATIQYPEHRLLTDRLKVVEPYGVSSERLQVGDLSVNNGNELIYINHQSLADTFNGHHCKKVELLPAQFSNQEILDLGLSHDSEFHAETQRQDENPYYRAGGGPEDGTPIIKLDRNAKATIHPVLQ